MEKEVVISIKGVQKYEGTAPDTMELVTKGRLSRVGESYTLSYQESELTGLEGTLTTIQVDVQYTLWRNVHRCEYPPPDGQPHRPGRRYRGGLHHRGGSRPGRTECLPHQREGVGERPGEPEAIENP